MLVLSFCFMALSGDVFLENLYKPLSLSQVSVATDGSVFVLDAAEQKILKLDGNGNLTKRFANKGQGPGELQSPVKVMAVDGLCHVTDYAKGVQIFDQAGEFVTWRKVPPNTYIYPQKVVGGWVYSRYRPESQQYDIVLCDEAMENPFNVFTYDSPPLEVAFGIEDDGSVAITYSPGVEELKWVVSVDMKKIFMFIPGTNDINVFDVTQRSITESWTIPFRREPLNQGWVEFKVEEIKNRVLVNDKKVTPKVTMDLPDSFPLISDLLIGPEGNIWLFDGPSLMEKHENFAVLDSNGQTISGSYHADIPRRVFGIRGEHAWVLCFDQARETPFLKRCRLENLPQVLARSSNLSADATPFKYRLRTR